LPIHTRPGPEALGEATRLEVEYGLALMGYMLEVARGFYNNTISLEGRTNKTAILLVEFWWRLHRKAEYMERVDLDKKRSHPRMPGASLVSYYKILQDADIWSERMLFNHLAYAAMRCTDQGFVTLDQLLSSVEIGTRESVQQMAQYKEATLVQQGPAREAFVGTVSQHIADRLQICRQFVRGEEAELGTEQSVAPIAPLTIIPADMEGYVAPVGKKQKKASKIKPTRTTPVEGVRRSARIAAARSMIVAAPEPAINTNDPAEQAQELMLLARACAINVGMMEDDREFEGKQGETPKLEEPPTARIGEASRYAVGGTIIERFYEYPRKIVALLELGFLKELEQGVFLRISDPSQRKVHPDLNKLSQKLRATQRERSTVETLLDNCQLIALGNDIFCDETFHQKELASSKAVT
jgi:hypothetical protein